MPITIDKRSIPGTDWSGLGESIRASGNRLADRSREEARYQEAQRQRREAEFLQMANVDPVSIISDNLQKKQAENIQQFISMAGEEYRSSNYRPTTLQKLKIQQAKNKLQSWQQSILSNQKMWQQAYDTIQQDKLKGTYDAGNFWERTQEFNDTGQLPGDLLLPREYGDIGKVFLDKKYSGKVIRKRNTVDANGRYTTTEVEEVADENERKSHMIGDIFDDIRLQYSISKQFNQLPPEVKQEYLNRYPNDQGNAITDWAYDTYKDFYAPKVKEINTGDIRSGGGYGANIYEIPEDPNEKLVIGAGKYKGMALKSKEVKGTDKQISSEVNVYGGWALPPAISGSITARPYYDMISGTKKKPEIGTSITLKYPKVIYVPVEPNEDKMVFSKVAGKEMPGYESKKKAVLLTSPNESNNKAIDLTEDVKAALIAKWPKFKDEISAIPMYKDVDNSEVQEPITEEKRKTKDGKTAVFDANTKQFLRYE